MVIDAKSSYPAPRAVSPRLVGNVVHARGFAGEGRTVEIAAGVARARLLVSEGGSFYHNVEEKLFNRARHVF